MELSQWPADHNRFLTTSGVQSDSGYSLVTNSSRERGGLRGVMRGSQLDRSFPAVTEESSPLREAADNVMRRLARETGSSERSFNPWSPDSFDQLVASQRAQNPQERRPRPPISTPFNKGYETWSDGGASQNSSQQDGYREKLPQLSSYVERMERRVQKTHQQSSSIPAVVNYNDNDDNHKPPPPPPTGPFGPESIRSAVKRTVEEILPMNRKTQRRKSLSDTTLHSERTGTTRTTQKNISSDIQSNISSST